MDIFLTIISIIVSLIALYIISIILRSDIRRNRNYKNAEVCTGTIVENLGIVRKYTYGRWQERKYERYLVRYNYNGESRKAEVLTVRRGLHAGDELEVHIFHDEDGNEAIASDIYGRRLLELVIAAAVAIVFSAVINRAVKPLALAMGI